MKTYRLKVVDAFTKKAFAGNPAGVVLDASGLTEAQMQLIAREINLSETAFILPASVPDANLQLRWFTNMNEVALCGHATIASFHALAEEGMEGMRTFGQHYFRLQTKSGILAVRVEKNFYGTAVEFELPTPQFRVKKKIGSGFLKAAGLSMKDIRKDLPVVSDSYIYLPVRNLAIIKRVIPDYQKLAQEMVQMKLQGVCVFSLETKEKDSAVHSRFFAPNMGIDEDPVTGSANGPLGFYLEKYAIPQGLPVVCRKITDGRIEFIGEQGDEINRAGRVKIRLRVKQDDIEDIAIAGEAVTILDATITI